MGFKSIVIVFKNSAYSWVQNGFENESEPQIKHEYPLYTTQQLIRIIKGGQEGQWVSIKSSYLHVNRQKGNIISINVIFGNILT